jgi:hypothetical protein
VPDGKEVMQWKKPAKGSGARPCNEKTEMQNVSRPEMLLIKTEAKNKLYKGKVEK